jgi:5-methylcytosine-specific restriction endonuclease McrA
VTTVIDSLDILLEDLVIKPPTGTDNPRVQEYQDFAFRRAATILRSDREEAIRWRFELRLRLALHLAPAEAIEYDHTNPLPRWKLISGHLVRCFERREQEIEQLARDIALTLESWKRQREVVTGHRSFLFKRDGNKCRHCHVSFETGSAAASRHDQFKPYSESPEELLAIEVDHIEAISALGTNSVDNLQLLCRLCNFGKGDGLGLDVRQEARFAGWPLKDIPRSHRASMLYYVVARDERQCRRCDSATTELTVRPIVDGGGFLRSNLESVCVNCA